MTPDLSPGMIAALLKHKDGPQPVIAGDRYQRAHVLALHDLVTLDRHKPPRQSTLTTKGRRFIADIEARQARARTLEDA